MEQYIKIPIPEFDVEYLQKELSGKQIQLDQFDFDPYFIGFHFEIAFILRDKVGNSFDTRWYIPKLKFSKNEGGNLNEFEVFTVPTTKDVYVKIERPKGMQPDAKASMQIKCKIF